MAYSLPLDITDKIKEIIFSISEEIFIVEIAMKSKQKGLLLIRIDTDSGIKIEDCTAVSRAVSRWLDEADPFEFEYHLEVTSPGVGEPLLLERQYQKEKGRILRVITQTGEVWEGTLIAVGEIAITLEKEAPKKKKKEAPEPKVLKLIEFSNIKEAKVIV